MTIKILAFGISKELIGKQNITITLKDSSTVNVLKENLLLKYPKLENLSDFMIAVNEKYAEESQKLQPHDEVAIIPPTNGG
jgi:molybdopterin converting factor subunit 1